MEQLDELEARYERIEAAERLLHAEKLRLVAELDARQANLTDGARSMTEWIARRSDMHPTRARRLVRAARAAEAPLLAELADGRLSVDRADAYAEAQARGVDLAGLDLHDISGAWRRIRRSSPADRRPDDRHLAIQPSFDRTGWKVWGRLDAAEGSIVADALSREADRIEQGIPAEHRSSRSDRMADALVTLALGEADYSPTVAVHLDEANAPAEVDGVDSQLGELAHALCVGSVTVDRIERGRPMSYGTDTKQVPPRLRRFIAYRDGFACTIDGCTSTYRLEPHHIIHAGRHGPTDPENLTSICWFHHHEVIHNRGFGIDPDSPAQRRRLIPPEH